MPTVSLEIHEFIKIFIDFEYITSTSCFTAFWGVEEPNENRKREANGGSWVGVGWELPRAGDMQVRRGLVLVLWALVTHNILEISSGDRYISHYS